MPGSSPQAQAKAAVLLLLIYIVASLSRAFGFAFAPAASSTAALGLLSKTAAGRLPLGMVRSWVVLSKIDSID